MRLHVPWAAATLLLPIAVSCKPAPSGPPVPLRPTPTFTTSWTPQQRQEFYHLAEGSEVIPTSIVRALWNPVTNRPIMADPERFGLIFDPSSADSLPVGVTSAETVDSRLFGLKMTGFNCSACHVAQISYRGMVLQVDGAPAHFNSDTLSAELQASIKWTLASPIRVIQFLERWRRYAKEGDDEEVLTAGGGSLDQGAAVYAALRPDATAPAGDTAHTEFVRRLHARIAQEAAGAAVDHGQGLGGRDDEPVDHELRARYTAVRDSGSIARVTGTRPNALDALAQKVHADERRAEAALHDYVEDLVVAVRLLKDRLKTIENFFPSHHNQPDTLQHTSPGAGRVDAFDVARNMIYPNDKVPVNAPVSFPWLWNFTNNVWLHYDANTNSVMERNIGQALGVGAVFDRYTAQSTLNPINIHRLEMLSRSIQAPAWPTAIFGSPDQAKVRRGEAVFNRECARCHFNEGTQTPFDSVYELWYVRTDSTRPLNFAIPLADTSKIAGRPSPRLNPAPNFTTVVGPLLSTVKAQSYALFRVPPAQQAVMNGCPNDSVWRTTRAWQSRPVSGIWATAPYLHNGSVPTLYDLLRPAAERPDSFIVGNPEYDPVKLGYVSAVAPGRATSVFRTNVQGNDNGGHEFGTDMSEDDRWALLEYLKGHTLPVIEKKCIPGPGTWPPGRVPPRGTR
ncbi:MAG TPA: di-heme-cytochrome C peroxidase [Longimicrobium sp.]|nr:di-heme-cytochrome C peroxidase [Longimicrobium sp.]